MPLWIQCQSKKYPLEVCAVLNRRPSFFDQYWFSISLSVCTAVALLPSALRSLYSGEAQVQATKLFTSMSLRVQEFVIHPVADLIESLFVTIKAHRGTGRLYSCAPLLASFLLFSSPSASFNSFLHSNNCRLHVELVVNRNELIKSHQALTRMLYDYSQKYHTPNTVSLEYMMRFFSFGGTSETVAEVGYDYAKVDAGIEKVWDDLMERYEVEMKNPIRGFLLGTGRPCSLLFSRFHNAKFYLGSLMTSMLIQMQKLKVHTEAEMLKMDKVLASNELTLAFSASIPAFLFFGGLVMVLKRLITPRRRSHKNATLALRMAYVEMRRSLNGTSYSG